MGRMFQVELPGKKGHSEFEEKFNSVSLVLRVQDNGKVEVKI